MPNINREIDQRQYFRSNTGSDIELEVANAESLFDLPQELRDITCK